MKYALLDTPIGRLRLVSNGEHLVRIEFPNQYAPEDTDEASKDAVLEAASSQLREYFKGRRRDFDLPLDTAGTQFQRRVWRALREIPYGQVRSYRELADSIGAAKAVRAVGAANGRNPLPIVVPCHRVIGSNGQLTGFAGGLAAKETLLKLEGAL